ncbi:MAG TPA: class I SAM-dependent methyltransferase [Saprospiraceae bacterium]|nr:class I SAM-dependent methyltransferase [Saprospiraceae bacterium]
MKKIICTDYLVTREQFELVYHPELDLLETTPKPKPSELPRYYKSDAYISHTDAKDTFFDRIYQFVKRYAVAKKVRLIDALNTDSKTLLDVGCGTGSFLVSAQSKKWKVSGIEPNRKAASIASQKLNSNSKIFPNLDTLLQDYNSNSFDVISLWHVLEHVPNYDEYIKSLQKLLKPNGVLLVAVPNYKSFDARYYNEYWAAYDVPRHLWHFSQKAIRHIFSNYHMSVFKILPMKLDAYYVSLLSQKNKNGKANYLTAFLLGLHSNLKARRSGDYSSLIYLIKNKN